MKTFIKKILVFFLCVVCFVSCGKPVQKKYSPDFGSEKLSVDLSNGLPSKWSAFSTNTNTEEYNNGKALCIEHSDTKVSANKYFGGVYDILDDTDAKNFKLETKLRFSYYDTDARWFAFAYHGEVEGEVISAYYCAVNVSGEITHGTINGKTRFTPVCEGDTAENIGDGEFHDLVIECYAGALSVIVDGKEVSSFDTSRTESAVGYARKSGKLMLIVSNCAVELEKYQVTYEKTEDVEKLNRSGTVATSGEWSGSTVAQYLYIQDETGLEIANTKKLSAVFVSVNGSLDVLDKNGKKISNLKELNITSPLIITVNDEKTAYAVLRYVKEEYTGKDISVSSKNAEILKLFNEKATFVGGVYDVTDKDLKDISEYVLTANKYSCEALLFSEKATQEEIRYAEARSKTAIVSVNDETEFVYDKAITSGASGVSSGEYDVLHERLNKFGSVSGNSGFFNVAHRGLCLASYENSIESFQKAVESGATHLELDIQITKDNKLAVMHDESIGRTTNGSGSVSSYTAEQLKNYKITKNFSGSVMGAGVPIPMLEDVFNEFKNTDVVLVIEIKTDNEKAVYELKRLIDEYSYNKNVVIISFYNGRSLKVNQLALARKLMPEIACGDLGGFTGSLSEMLTYMRSEGTFLDCQSLSATNTNFLKSKSSAVWGWTYAESSDSVTAIKQGVKGITNNDADAVGKLNVCLKAEADGSVEEVAESCVFVNGTGKTSKANKVTVYSQREVKGGYEVIYCAKTSEGLTVFSQPVTVKN